MGLEQALRMSSSAFAQLRRWQASAETCRLAKDHYNLPMAKRTSPADAHKISVAADLEELVQDKREGWRASGAKARRRQRRYKALLTQQLMKVGTHPVDDDPMDDDL